MGPLLESYAALATSAVTLLVCRTGLQDGSHGCGLGLTQEGTDSISDLSLLRGPKTFFVLLAVHI